MNCTDRVSLPAIPGFHHVLGNGLTIGSTIATENRPRRSSSSRAVTSAWVQNPAPEHQTFVPLRLKTSSPRWVTVSTASDDSAAHTPQSWSGSGGLPPNSSSIATASTCASAIRAATMSSSASSPRRRQRSAVRPDAGSGNSSRPDSSQCRTKPAVTRKPPRSTRNRGRHFAARADITLWLPI